MMLSILSCVCWQSVYLLWRNVYLFLWLIFHNNSDHFNFLPSHTHTHTLGTESLPLEIKRRKMCLSINNIYWVWTLYRPLSQVSRAKTGNINQTAQNSGKSRRRGNGYNHGKLLIHRGEDEPLQIVPFPCPNDVQSSYKISSH